ncbi:MAG: thioredoxin family protein [Hyphomicrobiaceae bacterium]
MRRYLRLALAMITAACLAAPASRAEPQKIDTSKLPPALGAEEPAVKPKRGDDGLYHQAWFVESFLNLKEDFAEAKAAGKRFVVIFEQRGCVYCVKLHTDAFAKRYVNDYIRKNFAIVQLNMWGDREVTDFDGTKLTEKRLAQRWQVIFTPTIIFFKDDVTTASAKWGQPLEVARLNQIGTGTIYDMFVWVKHKIYAQEPNFQRFHIQRIAERQDMRKKK